MAPFGFGGVTTTAGFGAATTFRPFMLLDVNSGSDALPTLPDGSIAMPPLPVDASMPDAPPPVDTNMLQMPDGALPPMGMPPMAMPPMAMPPMGFLQEGMQAMSGEFRSAGPIDGCSCACQKREAAMMAAQKNAMRLAAFPEEGEPVPWGHQE